MTTIIRHIIYATCITPVGRRATGDFDAYPGNVNQVMFFFFLRMKINFRSLAREDDKTKI
jgi:hypothetical protein